MSFSLHINVLGRRIQILFTILTVHYVAMA